MVERLQRWMRGESRPLLELDAEVLDLLSPFHMLLNRSGQIIRCGSSLQKLASSELIGMTLHEAIQPVDVERGGQELNLRDLQGLEQRPLRLQLRHGVELDLNAQLMVLNRDAQQRWLMDIRPAFCGHRGLEDAGLNLQDISLIDPLRTEMLDQLMEESLRQELLDALKDQRK